MRTRFFPLFYILMIGVLILSACNLPGNDSPATEEALPEEAPTATATMDLAATQTREAELIPTETPTITPTETLTPSPTATSTPEAPKAKVGRESNCRVGPGGMYDLVATYQIDQIVEIVAKDLGGGYWFVKNPDKPEEQCYILANNVTITGDTSALPQYTPLPSPTASPYFTFSFKKLESCKGRYFALFNVENAGSLPFRSFYIKVTNPKVDKSVEQALPAFDLWTGCIIAKNISPLEVGGTGYASSPPFTWEGTEDELRVILMLCTEKGLKGTCVTQVMDIKP